MNPQTEFLNSICETVEENCNLNYKVSLKELPKEGGLYAELGEGFTDALYYDKSGVLTMPVTFLCRDADQLRGMEQLAGICSCLRKLKKYPRGESYQWVDASVAKEPSKIARDEDGTYRLSCILNCRIIF